LVSIAPTEERKQYFNFSSGYRNENLVLYGKANKNIDFRDLSGKKIAFIKGSFHENLLSSITNTDFTPVYIDTMNEGIDLLSKDKVYAFFYVKNEHYTIKGINREIDIVMNIPTTQGYNNSETIATSKNNKEYYTLIKLFNKYLESGGRDQLEKLFNEDYKLIKKQSFLNSLSEEEKLVLMDKSILNISIDKNFYKNNHPLLNKNNSGYEGILIDIVKTKYLGM